MQRVPEPEVMDIPERARAYADADFAEVNAAFVGRLLERAPNVSNFMALDLGTGSGDIPLLMAKERPNWRIVAVDASRPMLQLASKKTRMTSVHFVQCDAKRLPSAAATFDVVFSNSILHHLDSPEPLWREVFRVTKPGATIFFRDLCRPQSVQAAREIVETYSGAEHPYLKEDFYNSLLAAYTSDEIRRQLNVAGIDCLNVEQVTDRHVDVWGII